MRLENEGRRPRMQSGLRTAAAVTIAVVIAGCSWPSGFSRMTLGGQSHEPAYADTVLERSTIRLTKAPSEAATCIAENARKAGTFADPVPLYGLEAVGVTVKESPTGEILAVFSLTRSDTGTAAATTTWTGVPHRAELIGSLTNGC